MNHTQPHISPGPALDGGHRPVLTILAIVALNSLGTGAIMNGIFFLARKRHGFDEQQNLLLGLVLGATYIVGAIGTGPLLRRLRASTSLTTRAALVWIHTAMGALCFVPMLTAGSWGIWVFAFTYSPLTGALWPIVESYLSGGRRGRSATPSGPSTWSGRLRLFSHIGRCRWFWARSSHGGCPRSVWRTGP